MGAMSDPSSLGLSERWRQAALEPYTDAPRSTDEWLEALVLGADAAVRVVLEDYLHRLNVLSSVTDGTAVEDMRARLAMHLDELTSRGRSDD